MLISINASPYHMGKRQLRREIFAQRRAPFKVPVVYVNQVGGNDSAGVRRLQLRHGCRAATSSPPRLVRRRSGDCRYRHRHGRRARRHVPTSAMPSTKRWSWARAIISASAASSRALIGLSGGIDSSLTAAIAVDAVGSENVLGVGMPGPYSSEHSIPDARELAQNLGIRFEIVPIGGSLRRSCLEALDPLFAGSPRRCHRRKSASPPARRSR